MELRAGHPVLWTILQAAPWSSLPPALFFILILKAAHTLVSSVAESPSFPNNSTDDLVLILKIPVDDKDELGLGESYSQEEL